MLIDSKCFQYSKSRYILNQQPSLEKHPEPAAARPQSHSFINIYCDLVHPQPPLVSCGLPLIVQAPLHLLLLHLLNSLAFNALVHVTKIYSKLYRIWTEVVKHGTKLNSDPIWIPLMYFGTFMYVKSYRIGTECESGTKLLLRCRSYSRQILFGMWECIESKCQLCSDAIFAEEALGILLLPNGAHDTQAAFCHLKPSSCLFLVLLYFLSTPPSACQCLHPSPSACYSCQSSER